MTARPLDGDRFAAAGAVADAVLYEGYVLYPYRASATKNQVRWQFGVLVPPAYRELDGSERSSMRTECLVDAGPDAVLTVRVRCLQAQHRSVQAAVDTVDTIDTVDRFVPTTVLHAGGRQYVEWDEAVDRIVDLPTTTLVALEAAAHVEPFTLAGGDEREPVTGDAGDVVGRLVRRRLPVAGRVHLAASRPATARYLRVAVTVENATEWDATGLFGEAGRRDDALTRSLIAVHTMLAVDGGVFVSSIDPPDGARAAAASCRGDGAYPVLVGADDVLLSSPIILYDHPEVAPESPGDLYDATEIDEILALRVLTLTDEEKAQARGTDARAAAIVDRCDALAPEAWERLHGAVRPVRPMPVQPMPVQPSRAPEPDGGGMPAATTTPPWWDPAVDASVDPWNDSVTVGGVEVRRGVPVRLRPSRRADAQDLFLGGLAATVAGVFTDVDGVRQVAVTVDDDPATPELAWQGRYLFFHPDELELLLSEERR